MIFRFLILLCTSCLLVVSTKGQDVSRYKSFAYRVNEGMLQSAVRDMAVDGHNFCWISYPNGIQKFDGLGFQNIPVQTGLPDDKWVYFFSLPSGNLLISHTKGISEYDLASNSFSLKISWPRVLSEPYAFMGLEENRIFLVSDKTEIFGFTIDHFEPVVHNQMIAQPLLPFYPRVHPEINNGKADFVFDGKILRWDLKQKKITDSSENFFISDWEIAGKDKQGNPLFAIVTDSVRVYVFDFKSRRKQQLFQLPVEAGLPFRTCMVNWNNKIIVSAYDRLFELDPQTLHIKSELLNFNKKRFCEAAVITRLTIDKFGSLYLQTINNGIRKLIDNNVPLKYYGSVDLKVNYALSVFADKANNRILVGGYNSGLTIFDTTQALIKHWNSLSAGKTPGSINQIIKAPSGGYFLLGFADPAVYFLSADLSHITPLKVESAGNKKYNYPSYFGNPLYQDDRIAIVQTQNLIFTINFKEQSVRVNEFDDPQVHSGLYRSPYLIVHQSDSLKFLDITNFQVKKSSPLLNTGGVRCYLDEGDSHFLVGTNKGVFRININGQIVNHWDKNSGLPDECIYAMESDQQKGIWCSSNRGIFRIGSSGSILQLTMDDGLQENEFNNFVSDKSNDGEIFFGGVNGVTSFFPNHILRRNDSLNIIFTNIRVNNDPVQDISCWNIKSLDLPHDKNALAFDFIAMSNGIPSQLVYQYRMLGVDAEWIQNSGTQTVRYFLAPGTYTFQVYASRAFNANAKAQKQITIVIHPQFWKTWWFSVLITILLLSIAAYIFNLIYRSRYEKKMLKLQAEQKLQSERGRISRDLHDSIGAYANTVLYKTQVLEKEKDDGERSELMDDLKFASRDIITSLRETVWALKNENFNAQDCFIRIRNFVQSFNKFYPGTHFKVEGDAPENYTFESSKALNLVRIIQEAITNAIKHGDSKNVWVKTRVENGNWVIVVNDDGKGFDMNENSSKEMGNGLGNMAERANESGFIFKIHSQPGRGTEVEVGIDIS